MTDSPAGRTKTHAAVTGGGSPWRRYQEVVVGRTGLWPTLRFELGVWLAQVPGALGLALRKALWPGLLGAVGPGALFGQGIVLRHPGRIRLGARVVLSEGCVLDARHETVPCAIALGDDVILSSGVIVQCKGATIRIGDRSGLGMGSVVLATDANDVTIGADVAIGPRCVIGGGNYNIGRLDVPIWRQGIQRDRPIVLEDDLWLGSNVTVLSGVRIGRGSIVAAGAVVTHDIPPHTLAGGVPAKPLRRRIEGGLARFTPGTP